MGIIKIFGSHYEAYGSFLSVPSVLSVVHSHSAHQDGQQSLLEMQPILGLLEDS